jgi:cation-transporting ATPase G
VAEEAGHGIGGLVDGRRVAVGSPRWIDAGPLKARRPNRSRDVDTS